MKKNNFRIAALLMLLAFFACEKNPIEPPANPPPVDTSTLRSFRLVLKNIPGEPAVITGIKAIITIKDSRNTIVASNKVVTIRHDQQYITDTIMLAKGNYSITGLLVKQGDTLVTFASPITGSEKAALVNRPLSVSVALNEKEEKRFDIEVLPVGPTDTPESFGYPAGSFGNIVTEPEEPMDTRIFVRPLIKIGDIVYDSVPVQLVLRSWNNQNEMAYKALYLPAGMQEIQLPAGAVRYQLSISKWNTYDELNLTKDEVQENTVYVIGGSKEAKKLKTVFEYKLLNGTSEPLTKTDYQYQPNGELMQMLLWGKREDKTTTYLIRKNVFQYQNSKITAIRGYDENDALITTSLFNYNAEGRIIRLEITEGGQTTTGTASYVPLEGEIGISRNYRLGAEYTHTEYSYKTYLSRDIYGGVVLSDMITTNHGNMESGIYHYDFEINPYAHLAIPDIYLNHIPKHNLEMQWKTWANLAPNYEPIEFTYTYDGDGYPTQLLTKYRSYHTKEYTYTIKTVFVY